MYSNFMLDFMSYFVLGYNVTASVKGRACAKLLRTAVVSKRARRSRKLLKLGTRGTSTTKATPKINKTLHGFLQTMTFLQHLLHPGILYLQMGFSFSSCSAQWLSGIIQYALPRYTCSTEMAIANWARFN